MSAPEPCPPQFELIARTLESSAAVLRRVGHRLTPSALLKLLGHLEQIERVLAWFEQEPGPSSSSNRAE